MNFPLYPEFCAPQRVYVENDWYDGPRAGVTDLNGQPHRFLSLFDEQEDGEETFLVWAIDESELALEYAQWEIFVNWNAQYEAGLVGAQTHPGRSGNSKRWEEIDALLTARRKSPPQCARRAKARMVPLEEQQRYALSGPAYQLSWALLSL